MQKDFDGWNIKKKEINEKTWQKFYHIRDIWWCLVGMNVGSEQDGSVETFQRPVLIVRGLSKSTCLVVPLSTSIYEHKYRIPIGTITGKLSCAIISQARVIDVKRLTEKIAVLDKSQFEVIRKSVKGML